MVWFLVLLIIALPAYLVRFDVVGIPTTAFEVLLYIVVLFQIFSRPLSETVENLKKVVGKYGLPILLFVVGAAIGVFMSPDRREALGLFKAYIFDPILLFGLIITVVKTNYDILLVQASLLVSGLIVGLSSFVSRYKTADGRSLGLYGVEESASPNFLALFLAPIASYALAIILFSRDRRTRALAGLSFMAAAGALVSTGSRGGLLALAFTTGITILIFAYQHVAMHLKPILKALMVLFVMSSLGLGWFLAKPNFSASASHRATTSNNLRYEIWRTTVVDIIPAQPLFGVGLGNYQDYFTKATAQRVNFPEYISPWARSPHNFFLNIWVNIGFLGLVATVWLIYLWATEIKNIHWSASWRFASLASLLALLVHGLVDAVYWKNDLAALFWLLLGLAVVMAAQGKRQKGAEHA